MLSDAAAELVVLLFEGLDELFVDLGQSADLAVFLGIEVAVVAADWGLDWGLVVLVVSDHPVHYNFIDFMIHPSPPYHHPIQNNQIDVVYILVPNPQHYLFLSYPCQAS